MYYVYILASGKHGTLYIGVTNNIRQRLDLHRSGQGSEFVKNTKFITSYISKNINSPRTLSVAKSN